MRKWVIMSAGSWMRKPSIEKIIEKNNSEGAITVAKLTHYNGDTQEVFILGAGSSPYGENNNSYNFIRDTGNGHSGGGYVKIENTIIISGDEVLDKGNGIGLNEKRSLWVFK